MPRRLYLKSLNVAYPGTLGDGLPEPPYGYQFVTDENGAYLLDNLGNYLVVPWYG